MDSYSNADVITGSLAGVAVSAPPFRCARYRIVSRNSKVDNFSGKRRLKP